MCNCIKTIRLISFFCGCVLLLVTACAAPKHSNTLIFGTNTKFALDVSYDTTGSPSITVGYKRQEAVWMPLLANQGTEGTPADCTEGECLFKAKTGPDEDTYSVLASFGAKFSGEGTAGGAKAAGGLAQYFATGLAARILAQEGGARVVSIQSADSELEEAKRKAIESVNLRRTKKEQIVSLVAPNKTLDTSQWNKLIDKTDLTEKKKSQLKACKDLNDVNYRLEMDAIMNGTEIDALYNAMGE